MTTMQKEWNVTSNPKIAKLPLHCLPGLNTGYKDLHVSEHVKVGLLIYSLELAAFFFRVLEMIKFWVPAHRPA